MSEMPYPNCFVCGKALFCRLGKVHEKCMAELIIDCPHQLGSCSTCMSANEELCRLSSRIEELEAVVEKAMAAVRTMSMYELIDTLATLDVGNPPAGLDRSVKRLFKEMDSLSTCDKCCDGFITIICPDCDEEAK